MTKYTLFPKLEEVFVEVTEQHKAVFFPLATIDLKAINKGNGKVHIMSYFRNGEDDLVTNNYVGYNFIRFKRVDNKYQFNGDFNDIYLFEKSIKWYQEAVEIYENHKEDYLTNSDFVKTEDAKREAIDFEYYYYIKGVLNYWVTRDKYLETGKFIQGTAYTYGVSNHEREPFENIGEKYDDEGYEDEFLTEVLTALKLNLNSLDLIATTAAYNYIDFGADTLMLFLDKEKNEVFQYYSWS